MRVGIDASNLRVGGGVTHLTEILRAADPTTDGFDDVVVWGGSKTLGRIESRDWLVKDHQPALDRGLAHRSRWRRARLDHLVTAARCDILFAPGGSGARGSVPMVTMSRNLLPFEWRELRRYGWSKMALKLVMLRAVQARTFRKADGVIFLTTYARDAVLAVTGPLRGLVAMIPHGIAERFFLAPRPQRETAAFTDAEPCRVLYVSVVDEYKHQWHVADAVMRLRAEGVPIELDLVGPPGIAMPRLRAALSTLDPTAKTIHSRGAAAYDELHSMYASADIGLFASSCENMPNILLEGMAAGLPMACSARGPMPEILQDAGVYFDPEEPATIADALRRLIDSPTLRAALATAAFEQAHAFSWRRCARETFAFLSAVRDASPRAAR